MAGDPLFVKLLKQYGKNDLLKGLDVIGKIVNLADDAPEHVVHEAVVYRGPKSARALWKFLQDMPGAVGAPSTAVFLIGCDPLSDAPEKAFTTWDSWLKTLYGMTCQHEFPTIGDGWALGYREKVINLVYKELDPFLVPRIRLWLSESGAKEDAEYIGRFERAVLPFG